MKKMEYLVLVIIFSFIFVLASCGDNKTIVSYYLNDSGNLIAEYDNGETTDLGDFDEKIIKSIKTVSFSDDGYYIIGEIKTSIKVDFSKVDMSADGYYIINGIKTSIKVDFNNVDISGDGYYVINGIKSNIVATNIYTVNFENCPSIASQSIREGYKVERPQNPIKKGYTFEGWYCNGEEWRFNSDVVMNDMMLTAKWTANKYIVSFIDDDFTKDDIQVTFDDDYSLPELSKDGYTFNGWLYNNEIVSSTKWSIDSDVTLTSSWTANKYMITLDPNGGSVSSTSIQVTYGENYKLPVPTNDFGIFRGWYIGDVRMTDEKGNSLEKWTFTADKTFTTNWIQDISNYNELQAISLAPNGYYRLVDDIDMKDLPWMPIQEFRGVLDGNGHSIKNLTLTGNQSYNSFFGGVAGTVKNLKFEDISITVSSGGSAAVLAYIANNALFENIYISGSVSCTGSSSTVAAGVVCHAVKTTFKNIVSDVNVTAKSKAAGITVTGLEYDINSFYSCINNGEITASNASGIASCGIFTSCKNTGTITGVDIAAGIATTIIKADFCVNTGTVSANTSSGYAAGIGELETSKLQQLLMYHEEYSYIMISSVESEVGICNSYNTGNISGKISGGIISGDSLMYIPVKSCYNGGKISGDSYAGGIAPYNCNVTDCVNLGAISSGSIRTSICAETSTLYKIMNCYYYGSAYDTDYCVATKTTERFSSDLFVDLLYWNVYTNSNKTGVWKLNENDYPVLMWEVTYDDEL